ncbi:hypothetical protein Ancab_013471 [Ancistrocladus abbreviatus]
MSDNLTRGRVRLDCARFAVHTADLQPIRENIHLKVEEDVYLLQAIEEAPCPGGGFAIPSSGLEEAHGSPFLSGFSSFVPETKELAGADGQRHTKAFSPAAQSLCGVTSPPELGELLDRGLGKHATFPSDSGCSIRAINDHTLPFGLTVVREVEASKGKTSQASDKDNPTARTAHPQLFLSPPLRPPQKIHPLLPFNTPSANGTCRLMGLNLGPLQSQPKASALVHMDPGPSSLNPLNAVGDGCGMGGLSGLAGSIHHPPPPAKQVGRRPRKKHIEEILQLRLSKRIPGKVKRRHFLKGQKHCDRLSPPGSTPSLTSNSITDDQIVNRNNIIRSGGENLTREEARISPQHIWDFVSQVGVGSAGDEATIIQRIAEMEHRDATEFCQQRDCTTEDLDQVHSRHP